MYRTNPKLPLLMQCHKIRFRYKMLYYFEMEMERTIIIFKSKRSENISFVCSKVWDVHLWTVKQEWAMSKCTHWTFSCSSVYSLCSFEMLVLNGFKWQKHRHLHTIRWFLFIVHCSYRNRLNLQLFLYILNLKPLPGQWKTIESDGERGNSFSIQWHSTSTMFVFSAWLCLTARHIKDLTVLL